MQIPELVVKLSHTRSEPAYRSRSPTGNLRIRAMRKLPVVPLCRGGWVL